MDFTKYCIIIEQDDGLNELASIVSRQKNLAITISTEVDLQNGWYIHELCCRILQK